MSPTDACNLVAGGCANLTLGFSPRLVQTLEPVLSRVSKGSAITIAPRGKTVVPYVIFQLTAVKSPRPDPEPLAIHRLHGYSNAHLQEVSVGISHDCSGTRRNWQFGWALKVGDPRGGTGQNNGAGLQVSVHC
jgi:antitoxin (DNA-binding transcriptional repressor) of toxin-antitoxin stability system